MNGYYYFVFLFVFYKYTKTNIFIGEHSALSFSFWAFFVDINFNRNFYAAYLKQMSFVLWEIFPGFYFSQKLVFNASMSFYILIIFSFVNILHKIL